MSGGKKKRGRLTKGLRTSNTTALICCICVVNVLQHRHGTCGQGGSCKWTATWSSPGVTGNAGVGRHEFRKPAPWNPRMPRHRTQVAKVIIISCRSGVVREKKTSPISNPLQWLDISYTHSLFASICMIQYPSATGPVYTNGDELDDCMTVVDGVKTFEGHANA